MGKAIYIGTDVLEYVHSQKEEGESYNKIMKKLLGISVPREKLATREEIEELQKRIDALEQFVTQHS